MGLYCTKGWSLRYSPGWHNPCCCVWHCMWGRGSKGNNAACLLLAGFWSLPLLPTSKLGLSGADFCVGGLVYILGPCGSLQWTLLWGWEFLLTPQPPQVFSVRGFEALFPLARTLGFPVCSIPQLFLPVYLHANVCLSGPPDTALLVVISTPAACLCHAYRSRWMFLP